MVSQLIYFYKGGLSYSDAVNLPLAELFLLQSNATLIAKDIENQNAKLMRRR